jgi:hypothetical protein
MSSRSSGQSVVANSRPLEPKYFMDFHASGLAVSSCQLFCDGRGFTREGQKYVPNPEPFGFHRDQEYLRVSKINSPPFRWRIF